MEVLVRHLQHWFLSPIHLPTATETDFCKASRLLALAATSISAVLLPVANSTCPQFVLLCFQLRRIQIVDMSR
jgi:hypothetical protein